MSLSKKQKQQMCDQEFLELCSTAGVEFPSGPSPATDFDLRVIGRKSINTAIIEAQIGTCQAITRALTRKHKTDVYPPCCVRAMQDNLIHNVTQIAKIVEGLEKEL